MIMVKKFVSQVEWMKSALFLKNFYETLTGIQMGTIEAPEGWIKVIEE